MINCRSSQSCLMELLGLLTDLGLLELWHLIYLRLLTGFGMLVFFTNLSLMEFQVRYLVLFLLFSEIENLHKNIQLMLEFLKDPFLVLLYINDLLDVVCDIAIYADDATLYSKYDLASDLW